MSAPNEATRRQLLAAQPQVSTWLSANAGSGKTKVLTDRVARLLLNGTPPQHILCLTYTKAAAAEMQNRLFKRLGAWAMKPDEALGSELSELAPDEELTPEKLRHARTLFARAVETPGGLKIQTIHSFCSALLRRFPLEAGVSPQFKEMDDARSRILMSEVLDALSESEDRAVIDSAALYISGLDPIDTALDMVAKREGFRTDIDADEIWSWFDLPVGFDASTLIDDVFLGGEAQMLLHAADLMDASSKNDQKLASDFRRWAAQMPSVALAEECCNKLVFNEKSKTAPFMSKFGAKSGSVPTKALLSAHPQAFHQLEAFMKRLEAVRPKIFALFDAERSLALHRFAQKILPAYLDRKEALGLLDFDDMIRKARDLLSISNVSEWVLFRLDGGIDHILVDEAQDTSPDQWRVIQMLAGEFTAGEGARPDVERTIFVVGDQKQSIYSFQGAAPEAFHDMKDYFADRLAAVGAPLQDLSMEHSFRSSRAILEATDAVFAANKGAGVGGDTRHISFFDTVPGRVDLWPLVEPEKQDQAEQNWEDPIDQIAPEHHNRKLARNVADFVARLLEKGSVPKEGGKPTQVEPGDILILVRSRSGLFMPMLNALKSHPSGIPVAGADVLKLNDELAVRDLKSLLGFLSLQDDDLALAEALRSPLFNWSERDLYQLAHGRTAITLWRALFERRDEWADTVEILDDLRQQADFLRPYDLLERILIRHDGRKKIVARLGKEAEDGIDALLNQARQYETTSTPSLTGFLAWLEGQDIKIKRVLDDSSNLVRVMTAHGAKGLEAPIVILPDTMKKPQQTKDDLIDLGGGKIVWKGPSERRSQSTHNRLEQIKDADLEEDRRLLYVAMTRAEKWLVVCGAGEEKSVPGSWYGLVQDGLRDLDAPILDNGLQRFQFGTWPTRTALGEQDGKNAQVLPDWALNIAPEPSAKEVILSPSDLGGAKALPGEENILTAAQAMKRGTQIHALLEVLPALEKHRHFDVARDVLANLEGGANDDDILMLTEEAQRVIAEKYVWDVFGKDGLVEVPFSAPLPQVSDAKVSGIIDRLIIGDTSIQIVDFKTNRVVPNAPETIPEGVLRQLGAYAEAMSQIYPDHEIEVAVLWTQTAVLMPVPLDIVMSALQRTAIS